MTNTKLFSYLSLVTLVLYFIHSTVFKHVIIEAMLNQPKAELYHFTRSSEVLKTLSKTRFKQIDQSFNFDNPIPYLNDKADLFTESIYQAMLKDDRRYISDIRVLEGSSHYTTQVLTTEQAIIGTFSEVVFYPYQIQLNFNFNQNQYLKLNYCTIWSYTGNCAYPLSRIPPQPAFFTVTKIDN